MTKVSKLPLRSDVLNRIFELFIDTVVDIHSKELSSEFIYEFFSPTERTMLAKRLAACVLLSKGHTYQSISRMLKMSPGTISRLSYWINHEGKGINKVISRILEKQSKEILIKEIVNIFDLPHKHIHSPEGFRRKAKRKREINRKSKAF